MKNKKNVVEIKTDLMKNRKDHGIDTPEKEWIDMYDQMETELPGSEEELWETFELEGLDASQKKDEKFDEAVLADAEQTTKDNDMIGDSQEEEVCFILKDDLEIQNSKSKGDDFDDTKYFFKQLCQAPLLSKEDEYAIGCEIRDGHLAKERLEERKRKMREGKCSKKELDELSQLEKTIAAGKKAEKTLVESNYRLVMHVIKKIHSNLLSPMDKFQEGVLGLMKAAEKFDVNKGFRFSTYACWWIRQSVYRALEEKEKAIRMPSQVFNQVDKLRRVINKLVNEHELNSANKNYSDEEIALIASRMDVTAEKVKELLLLPTNIAYLESPIAGEGKLVLGDIVEAKGIYNQERFTQDETAKNLVEDVFSHLSEKEKEVMCLRFGIGFGNEEHTLEDIGAIYGISRERVRQIIEQARRKIARIPSLRRAICEFNEDHAS